MKTVIVYFRCLSGNYGEFFAALSREGRTRNWRVAFVEPTSLPQPEENARLGCILQTLRPSGFVGGYVTEKHIDLPLDLPQVWVDCNWSLPGKPRVEHDNAAFGEAAAHALIDGGENYAAFGLDWRYPWSARRIRAFAAVLASQGLRCRRFTLAASVETQYTALDDICRALKRLRRPVSVFAVTDNLAAIVLMAAESLGWRCPGEIRVVGVDDNALLCTASPTTISSVHPDWAEGARLVVEALDAQMRGRKTRKLYLYGATGVTRRTSTRDAYRRPRDERVERGLAFIADEFDTPLAVADVVAKMGCSRRLADMRFREETGKSILETIEELRWERLQSLLARRDADLGRIPGLLGFRTPAALRAFVRRRSGGSSMTTLRAKGVVS